MSQSYIAHCQLGFRPNGPKPLTFVASETDAAHLPERIPFYLRPFFGRIPRTHRPPPQWTGNYLPWPFDISKGKLIPEQGKILRQGELVRTKTRWGTFWLGEIDSFDQSGNFQIETDFGCSWPIFIKPRLLDRIQRTFLNYLSCQRSGFEVPGVREADHLDDGIIDSDGRQVAANGGWYDAGDLRKWLFLTQPNLEPLITMAQRGHPGLRAAALDEIRWGNRYFQSMIAPDGQAWEDLAAGTFKDGLDVDKDWWYDNHPGCNCNNDGGVYTDNTPGTGDERKIRTLYNPSIQFMFTRFQCRMSTVLLPHERASCRVFAKRTWDYGRRRGHDRRTLFVAEELLAALEALAISLPGVSADDVRALTLELLGRQDNGQGGLTGYFMEKDQADGFRCIALSCEPAIALLRLVELAPSGLEDIVARAREALARHIDGYLLADATSNSFGLAPYGIYTKPHMPEHQTYRDAGRGRFVRTFIQVFCPQQIVHGTGGVITHQAALCAKAGHIMGRTDWSRAAERMIHWFLGHNPEGVCMHHGIGYKHPTPYSAWVGQLPDAISVGHVGRPDDTPYQETSQLVEWSTQEIWDIPHAHLAEAVLWL